MKNEFKIERYQPIDYREWILGDEARKGVNIKRLNLLTSKELEIFNKAIPYNDAREDPGQAEIVTYFALKLLQYHRGTREVVIPAATLHDIGWFYNNDSSVWKKLVKSGGDTETEAVRRPHQNRGIMLAGKILTELEYPEDCYQEIADIIGDHDTGKLPKTESGWIVRASDLLWRVTYPCMTIYNNITLDDSIEKLEKDIFKEETYFKFDDISTTIARIEITNTLFYNFRSKAEDIFNNKGYGVELRKIKKFYEF